MYGKYKNLTTVFLKEPYQNIGLRYNRRDHVFYSGYYSKEYLADGKKIILDNNIHKVGSHLCNYGVENFEITFEIKTDGYRPQTVIATNENPVIKVYMEKINDTVNLTTEKPIDVKISDSNDLKSKLTKLKELLDAGLIDQDDYEMKKSELLNDF